MVFVNTYNFELSKDAKLLLKKIIEKYDEMKNENINQYETQIYIAQEEIKEILLSGIRNTLEELKINKCISNFVYPKNGNIIVFLTLEGINYFENKKDKNKLNIKFDIENFINGNNNGIVCNDSNYIINNNKTNINEINNILEIIKNEQYYNNEELKETLEMLKEALENPDKNTRILTKIMNTLNNLSTIISIAGVPETILSLANLIKPLIN